MSIRKTLALSALTTSILLMSACASSPKQAPTTEPEIQGGSTEPDLVAELRERMAAGTLQRQEKKDDKKPSAATEDTSQSPTVAVDVARQQAALSVASDYARATRLMADNQDTEAMALLQAIAVKTPTLSGPVVNQAVILLKQKNYTDAEKQLRQALAINTRNPYAHNLLGITLREQGKFTDARAAYEAALLIDPNYAKAHFNLGVLADLYQQDLPFALSHYERYQALQGKPDPAVANWIIDLQKRTGVYKAPPPPMPAETIDTDSEQSAPEAAHPEAPIPGAVDSPTDTPAADPVAGA